MSLNLKKRRNFKYVTDDQIKNLKNRVLIDRMTAVKGEAETNYIEVVSKKTKITDKVPGMILTKLYVITFAQFILDFIFWKIQNCIFCKQSPCSSNFLIPTP